MKKVKLIAAEPTVSGFNIALRGKAKLGGLKEKYFILKTVDGEKSTP